MTRPSSEFVSKRIPLYYQLENLLREKILSGAFAIGAKLPTESELVRQYGVGRITVRQALATLAADGLIERRQGRGTFVTERKNKRRAFEGRIDLSGSLDEIIAAGADAVFKVIEMNRIEADQYEAELLGLEPGEPVYRLKRLSAREEKPYSLTLSYLPAEIGENLSLDELCFGSLLQLIETKFGMKLKSAKQRMTATLADPYLAKLLDAHVGAPLLSIERTVYADEDRPVEFVHALCNTDLYSYVISLTRDEVAPRKPEGKRRKR
ncbi:MAG: GntR family transcriptional regulator [Blastocatellales bacterium]